MSVETLVKFVAVTPGGGGDDPIIDPTSWTAQTGDVFGMTIAILLAITCIAFFVIRAYSKSRVYASSEAQAPASKSFKLLKTTLVAIIVALACAMLVNVTSMQVAAKQQAANGEITSPASVEAHVDEAAGTITIDNSYFMNGSTTDSVLNSITVSSAIGVNEGEAIWTINALGGTLYNDVVGKTITFSDTKTIAAGTKEDVKISTDMDIATAKSLIGQNVLKMSFTYSDSPTPPPPPVDKVKVNGVAIDINGKPIAGAAVNFYDKEGNLITMAKTDSQGAYTLEVPESFIPLDKGIIKVSTGTGISQDIVVKNLTDDVTLTDKSVVEPSTKVSGQIKDPDGNPIPNAEVNYSTMVKGPDGNYELQNFVTFTGEGGNYEVYVKQDHDYTVNVDKVSNPEIHTSTEVKVEKTPVTEDITVDETLLNVKVDLAGGSVKTVPEGWTSASAGVYTRQMNKLTKIASIVSTWENAGIVPPSGKTYKELQPSETGDTLVKATTLTAIWETPEPPVTGHKITGTTINEYNQPEANVNVTFTTSDGKTYTTTSKSDGSFELGPFKEGTEGKLSFHGTSPSKIAEEKDIKIEDEDFEAGKSMLEPSVIIKLKLHDEEGNPIPNADVVMKDTIYVDGEKHEENYVGQSDNKGEVSIEVKKGKNYTTEISFGTDPKYNYITTTEVTGEEKEPIDTQIDKSSGVQTITVNLEQGYIAAEDVPAGWTKTGEATTQIYTKDILSDINTIPSVIDLWTHSNFVPPKNKILSVFNEDKKNELHAKYTNVASVSGQILGPDGKPAPDTTVQLYNEDGKLIDEQITNNNGEYNFEVPEDFSGTVKPTSPDKVGSDIPVQNVTGEISLPTEYLQTKVKLTGVVTGPSDSSLPNVQVIVAGKTQVQGKNVDNTFTTKTNKFGSYSVEIAVNAEYTLTLFETNYGTFETTINATTTDLTFNYKFTGQVCKVLVKNISEESQFPAGWTWYEGVFVCGFNVGSSLVAIMKAWDGLNIVHPDRSLNYVFSGWEYSTETITTDATATAIWKIPVTLSSNNPNFGTVALEPSTFDNLVPLNSVYTYNSSDNSITITLDNIPVVTATPSPMSKDYSFGRWTLNNEEIKQTDVISEKSNFVANFNMPPGKSAKAVYDDGSSTNGDPTLTFYYDAESHEGEGTSVIPVPENNESYISPFKDANNSKVVVFDESFKDIKTITTLTAWFNEFESLESIEHFEYLYTENVTSMWQTFRCTSIQSLDLSLNNLSSLGNKQQTGLTSAFAECTSLESVIFPQNIKADAHMCSTFYKDYNLTYVNTSKILFNYNGEDWDSRAFKNCNNLKTIVTSAEWITSLKINLSEDDSDVSVWSSQNEAKLISADEIMGNAEGDTYTKYSGKAVYDDGSASNGDPTLTFYFDSESHEDEGTMVIHVPSNCSGGKPFDEVKNAKVIKFTESCKNFINLKSLYHWFYRFSNLETVENIENLNTSKVTNLYETFAESSLNSIDLSKNNLSSLSNEPEKGLAYTFIRAKSLESVIFPTDINEEANVSGTFYDATALQEVNAGNLKFYYPFGADGAVFEGCSKLCKVITTNTWETALNSNIGEWDEPYSTWHSEKEGWYKPSNQIQGNASGDTYTKAQATAVYENQTAEVGKGTLTFYYDALHPLSEGDWKVDDVNFVFNVKDSMGEEFAPWYSAHEYIGTISFDSSFAPYDKLTTLNNWFSQFYNLSTVNNLNNLNFSQINGMSWTFGYCTNLKNIDFSDCVIYDVLATMNHTFYGSNQLESVNFGSLKANSVTNMFGECPKLNKVTLPEGWTTKFTDACSEQELKNSLWLAKTGQACVFSSIPGAVTTFSGTFTRSTKSMSMGVTPGQESWGTVSPTNKVYFNDEHPGTYSISSNFVSVTINGYTGEGSTTYRSNETPNFGYKFSKWQINGEDVTDATKTGSVTDNMSITAVFEPDITAKAVYTSTDHKLTFYYDDSSHESEGAVYAVEKSGDRVPAWYTALYDEVTNVEITPDFYNFKGIKSLCLWFSLQNCKSVVGLKYIDTSSVTDMYFTFGESSIESVDLTENNLLSLSSENMSGLCSTFGSCTKLTDVKFPNNIAENANVVNAFCGCNKLQSIDLKNLKMNLSGSYTLYPLEYCDSLTEIKTSATTWNHTLACILGEEKTGNYTFWKDKDGSTKPSNEITPSADKSPYTKTTPETEISKPSDYMIDELVAIPNDFATNNVMLDMFLTPVDKLFSWVKVVLQIT